MDWPRLEDANGKKGNDSGSALGDGGAFETIVPAAQIAGRRTPVRTTLVRKLRWACVASIAIWKHCVPSAWRSV